MPSLLSWKEAYESDKVTSLLLYPLIHKQLFAKNTLSSFPAQYCRAVATNSFSMIECRLVFFEKVATAPNKICRIVVPISLRRIFFLFCMLPQLLGVWGSRIHYIDFFYDSFGLGCVLTSINGSRNVHIVGWLFIGAVGITNSCSLGLWSHPLQLYMSTFGCLVNIPIATATWH